MKKTWYFWIIWEWLLIFLILICVKTWIWLVPIGLFLIGTRQHALAVLGHEIAHKTVNVSDRIGNYFTFWTLGLSLESYRYWHMQHHAFLGTEKDPEMEVKGVTNPFILLRILQGKYDVKRIFFMIVLSGILFVVGGLIGLLTWFIAIVTTHWLIQLRRANAEHYIDENGNMQTTRYVASWWQRAFLVPHYIWKHWDHHSKGRMSVPCWQLKE